MQRVISIQTSRGFGDEGESVTKRFCCSFVFSVSFLAILGGFFLGRFSTYREFEIKKTHLETERVNFYERHTSYVNSLNTLEDALTNLTEINKNYKNNENRKQYLNDIWNTLSTCPPSSSSRTILLTHDDLLQMFGENFNKGVNYYVKTFIDEIINCVQSATNL